MAKAAHRILTDQEEIREWAEERGAHPSRVKGTGSEDDPGLLRLDFPGYSGEGRLEPISWEEFFEKFDEKGLALLVEDRTAGGQRSNFNKIISRETAMEARAGRSKSSSGAARGRSSSRSQSASRARTASRSRTTSGSRSASRKQSGSSRRAASSSSSGRAKRTSTGSSSGGRGSARNTARKKSTARSTGRSSQRRAAGGRSGSSSRRRAA